MDITPQELAAAWPRIPEQNRLAIVVRILEDRLAERDAEIAGLRHQIEVLEQAVKAP